MWKVGCLLSYEHCQRRSLFGGDAEPAHIEDDAMEQCDPECAVSEPPGVPISVAWPVLSKAWSHGFGHDCH